MQDARFYLGLGWIIPLVITGLVGCNTFSELPNGFKSPQVKGNAVLDKNGAMITVSPSSIVIQDGARFSGEQLEKIKNKDPDILLALHRSIAAAREATTEKPPTLNLRIDERTSNRLFQALLVASFQAKPWKKIALGVGDDSKSALNVSVPEFGSETKPHPLMLMATAHLDTLTIQGRQPIKPMDKMLWWNGSSPPVSVSRVMTVSSIFMGAAYKA